MKNNLSDMSVSEVRTDIEDEEQKELAEQEQPLEEEQKKMCRMLQRIIDEKYTALEEKRSELASCAKRCHQLKLQHEEANDFVDLECNMLQCIDDEKYIALEVKRSELASCAKRFHQLKLQYEEAKDYVEWECDIHEKNILKIIDKLSMMREPAEQEKRLEEEQKEMCPMLERIDEEEEYDVDFELSMMREPAEQERRHDYVDYQNNVVSNYNFGLTVAENLLNIEAIEQRQHEELFAEKLFALEDMRFEMVSSPKKSEELKLQYEEEQKKVYFECNLIF